MRPVLLRPPLPRSPSVKDLTGFPFHSSLRSTITSWRRDGVVGLNVFSAMPSAPFPRAYRNHQPLSALQGGEGGAREAGGGGGGARGGGGGGGGVAPRTDPSAPLTLPSPPGRRGKRVIWVQLPSIPG